jgi:hypothetical protein
MRTKVIGVGILAIAAVTVLALTSTVSGASDVPAPSSDATGDDYAEELGLIRHQWEPGKKLEQGDGGLLMDGVALEGCEKPSDGRPSAFEIMLDGGLYCFSAPTDIEVWIISERLSGHIPTEAEIQEKEQDYKEAQAA